MPEHVRVNVELKLCPSPDLPYEVVYRLVGHRSTDACQKLGLREVAKQKLGLENRPEIPIRSIGVVFGTARNKAPELASLLDLKNSLRKTMATTGRRAGKGGNSVQ
jgi:hypothetical protein